MNLSMSLIESRLQHYHHQCELIRDELTIRGIRFLSDSRLDLSEDYVYLGKASAYFSDDRYQGACFLVNGRSRIVCFDCDYEELLNDVLGIFEFFNRWENKMQELASSQASIQTMLDATQWMDGTSILSDLNGNVLGAISSADEMELPGISDIIKSGVFPSKVLSEKYYDETGTEIRDLTDHPTRCFLEDRSASALVMYLCQDGEPVAQFHLFDNNASNPYSHIHVQMTMVPFLLRSQELSGANSVIRSNRSILLRLLSGEAVPPQALDKLLSHSHLTAPWLLLQLTNLTIQNHTQRSLMIRELTALDIPCLPIEYAENVLVLLSQRHQAQFLRRVTMLGANVAIGISMPVYELSQLPIALRQVHFASGYAESSGVYPCQKYALEYLLQNLYKQELVKDLLHPAIIALDQYDQENGTELLNTLTTYLQSDRNQIETASHLHTHRNTIKYRLERIDQITGIHLSDWRELTYLNLSVMLCRYSL